ncbi:MAG: hypothetical protein A2506_06020 [Elusimicrobia bacterium RIFOXYD12_FULL_66_9]|nr:MAG: hypothetical protein A2506_06020 [Elusimicrobia bacterium RIFOXYD12_FULL_66_9]
MDEDAIDALLRKAGYRPTPAETELFVLKVMAALPSDSKATPSWLEQRWFAPALGLAFAALVVSLIPFSPAEEDAASSLVAYEWTQPASPQSADEVLGIVLESR